MKKRHATGAWTPSPLPQFAWQQGKTLESVWFVADAADFILKSNDPILIGLLVDQMNKIKSGEVVLTEPLSPQEYIHRVTQGK